MKDNLVFFVLLPLQIHDFYPKNNFIPLFPHTLLSNVLSFLFTLLYFRNMGGLSKFFTKNASMTARLAQKVITSLHEQD